ncbi:MAG: hypothetical protein ACI85I_002369 [Arenicella sp.]|jgi:hypothetical protein
MSQQEEWAKINFNEAIFGLGEGKEVKTPYEVSNWGRLKSYAYQNSDGRVIKGTLSKQGHRFLDIVTGWEPEKGRPTRKKIPVHKLVAFYFVENDDSERKISVIHKDYDKQNNKSDNLEWATPQEAGLHAWNNEDRDSRLNFLKITNRKNKLSPEKAEAIRRRYSRGNSTMKQIAKQYGVSEMQISRVIRGENWSNRKF